MVFAKPFSKVTEGSQPSSVLARRMSKSIYSNHIKAVAMVINLSNLFHQSGEDLTWINGIVG